MHTPQLVTLVVTFPLVLVTVVVPVTLVPSTVHFVKEASKQSELGSIPESPVFPSRARDCILGGKDEGRDATELDVTRRVRTLGRELARSEARAVRELKERSLLKSKEEESQLNERRKINKKRSSED